MCRKILELSKQFDISKVNTPLEAGRFALSQKKYDKAQSYIDEASEGAAFLDSKAEVFLVLGLLNHYNGDLMKARRHYKNALAFDMPFINYSCSVKLGVLCLQEGNNTEAMDYLKRGTALCHERLQKTLCLYDVLYHLALAQLGMGQSSDAFSTYQQALEVCCAKGIVQEALRDLELLSRTSMSLEKIEPVKRLLMDSVGL